ncbi:hypothetical protein [Sphingomonas sp. M1-B02]|uniref:hypothetical protein n=1 Tax=Sphingomonas sp. M1-B02 TaxID=3114300 RepID=UPI00223FF207|nr:hypothetical protein [Sphingomonas sp. S6-11]UZK67449.1 hypothetical protein OKW87_06345 [Sphingomonas sp. S6-11]
MRVSPSMVLASHVFAGVGTSLAASAFACGAAALDADDRIVYDANTGRISYDADGSGAGAAILFALVNPGTALTSASFEIVPTTVMV